MLGDMGTGRKLGEKVDKLPVSISLSKFHGSVSDISLICACPSLPVNSPVTFC